MKYQQVNLMEELLDFISREFSLDFKFEKNIQKFSCRAHWWPPCQKLTPKFAKAYNEINDNLKNKLDIVFISLDKNEESFNEYFKDMPWKALPFSGMYTFIVNLKETKFLGFRSRSFEDIGTKISS
jgi:hypothetical protein